MFGFLNIYKPVGMTSHDVVAYLRRVTKIKQIGHTGTLDPFAQGVLPIAIGKATRLIEYLDDDKAYIGRFCFGKSTTTYDIEGEVVKVYDEKITEQDIINLPLPQGEIEQYPPVYSAKKINGKKLYELAREGKGVNEIDIKPCKITIYEMKLIEFNEEEQWADIYVKCSKGTYIRSLANDLGKSLNNACYLSKLERVQAGLFKVEDAIKLDELEVIEDVEKNIANPTEYLPLIKQELNETEYNRIIHGMPVYNRTGAKEGFVQLVKDNKLIAVSEVADTGLKAKKVVAE